MANLINKKIQDTYKDLLTVNSSTDNEGIKSTLKTVSDGEGNETAIQLSTTHLKIPSGKTLEIAGTLSSINATLTGDLSVGDDLTVTDLISGASMVLTGEMRSDNATIGGGYGIGGSGATITSAGNIQANGLLAVDGTSTLAGTVQIGGGYSTGGSGATITSAGHIEANGSLVVDGTVTCQQIKSASGSITSGSSTTPKVKLDDDTKVKLTVTKSGADKEILTVDKTGKATFKDEDGDTKLEIKDDGRLKFKTLTTTQRDALSSPAVGEMVVLTDGRISIYI